MLIQCLFGIRSLRQTMRYIPYQGLSPIAAWVKLKLAALNLKKFAIHKEGAPKGFYSLEKNGIVGSNIGYAVFSCLTGISMMPTQL